MKIQTRNDIFPVEPVSILIDDPPNRHTQAFLSLKKSIIHKGLALVKEDKGESLVITEKSQYEQKMEEFFTQVGAFRHNTSLNTYNKEIRSEIKKTSYVITGNKSTGENLFQMNSSLLKIYGQAKIHKTGHPMRALVAFYTTPYWLAKYLAE